MALVTIKTEPESTNNLLQICRLCLSEEFLIDVSKEEGLQQWIADYLSIIITTEDTISQAICAACRLRLAEFHQFHIRCHKVQDVLNQHENTGTEGDQLLLKEMLKYGCIECGKMFVLRQHLDQHMQTHVGDKNIKREQQFTSEELQQHEPDRLNFTGANPDLLEYTENTESQNVSFPFISSQIAKKRTKNPEKVQKSSKKNNCTKLEKEQLTCFIDMIDIEDIKIEENTDDDMKISDKPASPSNEVDANESNNRSIKKSCNVDATQNKQKKSDEETEECDICHKKYANKPLLWSHCKLVHQPKNYKCNVCEIQLSNERNLKMHNNTSKHLYKMQKLLEMQLSGEEYSNEPERNDGASEPSVNKIDRSEYRFYSEQPIDAEEVLSDSSVHTSSGQPLEGKEIMVDKPFKCDSCHKSFASAKKLRNHKTFHKPKKFICPVCGKPFLNKHSLEKHIPSHNAVRDWQRNRNVSMKRNKNVDKPYKCEICLTSYRTASGYSSHKKQVHGPKIHECHLCTYKSSTRQNLALHVSRHYHLNVKLKDKNT